MTAKSQLRFSSNIIAANARITSSSTTWAQNYNNVTGNNLIPGPNSIVLVAYDVSSNLAVSGITSGTGTFISAGTINDGTRRLELWVGYNFGTSYPTQFTLTRAAGTPGGESLCWYVFDILGDATTAPTVSASAGGTGTGTAADPGAITPAVDDILITAAANSSNIGVSSVTLTGNPYGYAENESITPALYTVVGIATAASSSKAVVNWSSSATWLAIQAKITPGATPPTPPTSQFPRGLNTDSLDQASSY